MSRRSAPAVRILLIAAALAGCADRPATEPPAVTLGQALTESVQAALDQQGFQPGRRDGTWDASSRRALADFQRAHGLAPTGDLDEETLAALELPGEITPRG